MSESVLHYNVLDPLRALYLSIFAAATAAAASVRVHFTLGVFGRCLAMSSFSLRFAVVVILALLLVVTLLLRLQLVLLLTDFFVKSLTSFAQVIVIVTAVMLALLLGDVDVILTACHLGVVEVSDG